MTLKKLELEKTSKIKIDSSTLSSNVKRPDFMKLISKYNYQEEFCIYLTPFERQIKAAMRRKGKLSYLFVMFVTIGNI